MALVGEETGRHRAVPGSGDPDSVGVDDGQPDPSTEHLLDRIGVIEARVHAEVERRRATTTPLADERFLGLYVSDLQVDELLAAGPPDPVAPDTDTAAWLSEIEADADALEVDGTPVRLRRLARRMALSPLDVELLLVALAPDIDARFEPLYGYLNDDVSQRRATVGLALQLCGVSVASGWARARLAAGAPLVDHGLLTLESTDRPLLSRHLRVPDRVVAFLLGDDRHDGVLAPGLRPVRQVRGPVADRVAAAVVSGAPLVYLLDRRGADAAAEAAGGLAQAGIEVLRLDLAVLPDDATTADYARSAAREVRLRGAGLVAGPVDALSAEDRHLIGELAAGIAPLVLHGEMAWDPAWSTVVPTALSAELLPTDVQDAAWSAALGEDLAPGLEPALVTSPFRLDLSQIERAARSARRQAAAAGRLVTAADLQRGARSQNAAGLQRLARRVEPSAVWDDLVLPTGVTAELRQLTARWRHRDQVLEEWGLRAGGSRGRGVSALFSGASGTGKTLATEVIASDLGLDLYLVDLSTVVDKYIGETSKNLERIFDEADRVNGVLLFDEADALFGKRSAVSDAKDRHANVEVAFLLQRMETFDGVVILTTNLAANLDDAFMRRLDAIVDFPSPDEPQRRRLWEAKLRPELPLADDLDLDVLAERFRLSGSEIRNVVLTAAYTVAQEHRAITMEDLVLAIVREHRKIGRHLSRADLGEFAALAEDRG